MQQVKIYIETDSSSPKATEKPAGVDGDMETVKQASHTDRAGKA